MVAVDNTFMGPTFQHPLVLGADLSVYSATKYLGGFSDMLGGVIIGRDPARAGKAGLGAWLGFIVGTAVRLSFAFAMIGLFVLVSLW